MTPFKEDLIIDQTCVSTYVDVANGNIVKAPLQRYDPRKNRGY